MKPLAIAIGGLSAALINNGIRKMQRANELNSHKHKKEVK